MAKEREYVTAISIMSGIIQLIEPNGEIAYYRQRGMSRIPSDIMREFVLRGKVVPNWVEYKELPSNYSISFEDEDIMGKARASFPYKSKK